MLQGYKGGIKGFRWHQLIEIFCHLLWNWLWDCRLKCQYEQYFYVGRGKLTLPKTGARKIRKILRRKNTCETGNGVNERAVSRFYLYDSCFSISSWRSLHCSSQWPNTSCCLVFQHPNNVVHFEQSVVAVWPFWPPANGCQKLFHQASLYMVHQLLRVLPCLQACRLLVSKLSWWQAIEGTLEKKMVWSQRLLVRLLSNVKQWSGVKDGFCLHHDC